MAWVVDTSILLDIAADDAAFADASERLLEGRKPGGLVICPVSYVELAPAFSGDRPDLERFLNQMGVSPTEPWITADTHAAFAGRNRFIQAKRQQQLRRRPVADVLIGAFASRFDGLLTRKTPPTFVRCFRTSTSSSHESAS